MKKIQYIGLVLVAGFIASCEKSTSSDCVATTNSDCICTMEYAPVCGCDDITYSNTCAANCADVKIESQGECPE